MAHVIFFLKSDVDDRVRDFLTDTVEELGFSDNYLELGVEVDLIFPVVPSTFLDEDWLFEHSDGCACVFTLPVMEEFVFVDLSQVLSDTNVVLS